MSEPVSTIRNLGPASDRAYARAGIHTAKALRDLGPDEAYYRYLACGGQAHFIGYYALVMGLQGRPWNDCQGDEKTALRARFDDLKSRAAKQSPQPDPDTAFEDMLNLIGVIKHD